MATSSLLTSFRRRFRRGHWIGNGVGALLELGAGVASATATFFRMWTPRGAYVKTYWVEEEIQVAGSTSDPGTTDLIPVGEVLACVYRITAAAGAGSGSIGGTSFKIGDGSDDDRFFGAQTTYTVGTTGKAFVDPTLRVNATAATPTIYWTGTMNAGDALRVAFLVRVLQAPQE